MSPPKWHGSMLWNRRISRVSPLCRALELLNRLDLQAWAIVTCASRELALRRLDCADLPHPRHLVSSEEVICGKPAPDGFLLAAK